MSIYNQTKSENPTSVSVRVLSKDRGGLVGEITTVITAFGGDITAHKARVFTDDKNRDMSLFEGSINLDGEEAVQTLLHRLHKIRGVVSVTVC
jgi:(p)ppGpp synthase/HD superfamily hydrolase